MNSNLIVTLEKRNKCLDLFLEESENFLESTKMGDFSNINQFQEKRESALKGYHLADNALSQAISSLSQSEKTPELINSVKKFQDIKNSMIYAIFLIDKEIIENIEKEKTKLLQEINFSEKNKKIFGKFKSKWVSESGEKLDGKI